MSNKVKEAIRKNEKILSESTAKVNPGNYSHWLKINGGIESGGPSKQHVACLDGCTFTGEIQTTDPDTHENLSEKIDLSDIKSFKITGDRCDVIQMEFETYDGNWLHCILSEFKISINDLRAVEWNLPEYYANLKEEEETE
jgi:hypothetical protein